MSEPEQLSVDDVFPIRGYPRYTYQPREDFERRVQRYAESGSGVLLVYGPTKSGKSVLVKKVLPHALYVEAPNATTAEEFWNVANTTLGTFTGRTAALEAGHSDEVTLGGGLSGWIGGLFVRWKGTYSKKKLDGASATDPANVVVLRTLRASSRVLIIDDLHILPRDEQRKILQNVKPFVDNGGRVVVIAAGYRAPSITTLVPNMSWSSTVEFTLWDARTLENIAEDGWAALNLSAPAGLAAELAEQSYGSPQTMQKLSSALAHSNGYEYRQAEPATLTAPADDQTFYKGTLSSVLLEVQWLRKLTDGPAGRPRNQYKTHSHGDADGYKLIVLALRDLLPNMEITSRDLQRKILEITTFTTPPAAPRKNETTSKLASMSKMASRPILDDANEAELERDNETAGVDPVLEYQENEAVVRIVDPLFAFALRWWPI